MHQNDCNCPQCQEEERTRPRDKYNGLSDREYERHWPKVRRTALDNADWRCQFCNAQDPEGCKHLCVHHRTYENEGTLAEEGDLIALCRWCHRSAEGAYEKRRREEMDYLGNYEETRIR